MHGGMTFNLNFLSGLQDMVKQNATNIQSNITAQISNVQGNIQNNVNNLTSNVNNRYNKVKKCLGDNPSTEQSINKSI